MNMLCRDFADGESIPIKYTCDGGNLSPPLDWTEVPRGTKSLALICDDPDAPAGTWVHWLMYNIAATNQGLPEHIAAGEMLPGGAKQGITDFGRSGYGGPCPPPGKPHRYFFKLYALDVELPLKSGATKPDLLRAMKGHVLAEASLMGIYQRATRPSH